MKLKSKLRLALELCLVMSALPLLLLGCGGGGGGGSGGGVQGQYWTELTSTAGLREFYPGSEPSSGVSWYYPGSYAYGYIDKAPLSGGAYVMSYTPKQMTAGHVWGAYSLLSNHYYLTASGWSPLSYSISLNASDATHYTSTNSVFGNFQGVITVNDLSGKPIVASSAVPAVTSLGMASAVSPASATYPAGSYEYDIVDTITQTNPVYALWANPEEAVNTASGVMTGPLDLVAFRTHITKADPVCIAGFAWVKSAMGTDTYDGYQLTFNSPPVAPSTMPTCQNSHIAASSASFGTYDLSLVSVNGTPLIRFTNPIGWSGWSADPFGDYIIGRLPADNTVYTGTIYAVGTSTSTSYMLNKTAMDAALTAWGVPTF